MAVSSAQQMRDWTGPAILVFGFRPFFLGAAVWAALAMILWVLMLAGQVSLPTVLDPISWHAHEFLFGYLGAVISGFLLTAVPNWTGRLPIVGWRLGGLALLWLLGRVAMAFSAVLPAALAPLADLAFPVVFALAILQEIVAGRNWRNLGVLAMLLVFVAGNLLFHLDAARGDFAAQGVGLRLGLAAAVALIAVVGGRIIPSFTRNWLVRQGSAVLPRPPMQRLDKAALAVLVVALGFWVIRPEGMATAGLLGLAGGLHLLRLAHWAGFRTLAEPLVAVLHLSYLFVPLGALTLAAETVLPGTFGAAGAQHLWMAGAIGMMTLAVMTRATLGHTGQTLHAGLGTVLLYLFLVLSVVARLCAAAWPALSDLFYTLAGLGWVGAFGGFAVLYGRLLLRLPAGKRL